MTWSNKPHIQEWTKIVWELVPYTGGRGLDVGCGVNKAYPHMIGVDSKKDKELFNNNVKPDVVADALDLGMFADGSMDFVFSSHTLEHIQEHKKALKEWWRVIKPGGHLVLYLPHKDFYPNIGTEFANPDHVHDFLPQDIINAMKEIGTWDLRRNEPRNDEDEYSFFQVFKKCRAGEGQKYSYLEAKPKGKTCAIVRYGAWGDALQTSSVIAAVKKEGYRITFYGTERAWEVLRHDPNIDEVYLQGTDQVPNGFLDQFWAHEQKKYDKWVNLCETVESSWLPVADKDNWHGRAYSVRKKYLDHNYLEFMHDVAEVPFEKPLIKFYPTLAEKNTAYEFKKKVGGRPLIVWALAGSSVHKIYPHVDNVLAWLMLNMPDCRVVTVGDEKCKMIEDTKPDGTPGSLLDWDKVPCVVKASGRVSIRDTLALAQIADLVIGPETGVLSAVSMEAMPKIVLLSHSTHENLTRDWVNTFALFSQKTKCYPCHRLHYTWKYCNESKEIPGVAQCAYDIPPEAIWTSITRALKVPERKVVPMKAIA